MRVAAGIAFLLWSGVAAAQDSAPRLRPLTIFGYTQVHYRYAFGTGVDSLVDYSDFRVQRVRIGIKGDVNPWVSYDVEIDPRAPSITSVLRDAFLEFKGIPRQVIRVGQQKTHFGYENRVSSSDLFVVNRSEVSDNLSRGANLRDIGIGIIGNLKPGPRGLRIEDGITIVNGAGMNVQADNTPTKNVWARLGLRWRNDSSDFTARFGISGGAGDLIDPGDDSLSAADDFRLKFNRYAGDLEIDHRRFFLTAEYVGGHDENRLTGETDEPYGFYLQIVGKLAHGGRMGPLVRYDQLAEDSRRWTLGAFYGLAPERVRFLLNYEVRLKKDGARGDDKLYVWTQVRF
jgi:phosphate-selective porin O/P